MLHISDKLIKSLIIIILILSPLSIFATDWPIQRKIDLSSGFGDFRANRFHTGIDIRTGGKVGTQLIAPVSGYIQRIRTSYNGYGKGLYLKGDDGFIYVFGHLHDFQPKIDLLIKAKQRADKRYFQDFELKKDEIRIKKGEFLGYTGQTGAGAPHLHFEKRTANNFPLNPLTNGFSIKDKIKPTFSKIGFKMLDNVSLFDNGNRNMTYDVKFNNQTNQYYLDTLLYFNRPFGLFTSVYDQMKNAGMKQSIYKLTLKIDKKEFYQVTFEQLDFDKQKAVNFRYEYHKAVNKEKRFQRLYNAQGNDFNGSISANNSNGIIGLNKNISYGHHTAEIIAEDCFGNKRSLTFDFIFGPQEELYQLDSHIVKNRIDQYYFFSPTTDLTTMKIDSTLPYLNRGDQWGVVKKAEIKKLDNSQLLVKLKGSSAPTTTIRLFMFSKNAVIRDNLFSGVMKKGKLSVRLNYEILEDGLLVNLNVKTRQSSESRIELFYKDSLLDVLYPTYFNMTTYRCFIPPLEKYEHIDKIGFAMSKDTTYPLQFVENLNLTLVGHKNKQIMSYENIYFEFNKENFYSPRFIEIDKRFYLKGPIDRVVSSLVEIKPEAFLCKSNFKVSYTVKKKDPFYERAGICWYSEDEKKWVWLDNQRDGHTLTAESSGGGTFAVVYDLAPPVISRINLKSGLTYKSQNLKVTFLVEDVLSDIADDQSFKVKLDKEWLIPEYDTETKQFIARPAQPLSHGNHHLSIEIVDRVGNLAQQYLKFFVKNTATRKTKGK